MKSVRIGSRRLYDSMGSSIANQQTFNLVFPFVDHLQAEIYMGNKPKFGITIETEHDDYIIPGAQMRLGRYTYHADATQSAYPRTFFTEIHTDDYSMVMDLLCGIIGLRFHPQFIQKLLNENFVAFHNEQRAYNHPGSSAQILDNIQLNQAGMDIISQMLPALGKVEAKVAQKSSKILGWLIRAWAERDIIARSSTLFLYLLK